MKLKSKLLILFIISIINITILTLLSVITISLMLVFKFVEKFFSKPMYKLKYVAEDIAIGKTDIDFSYEYAEDFSC